MQFLIILHFWRQLIRADMQYINEIKQVIVFLLVYIRQNACYNNTNMFRRALIIGLNDNLVSGACHFEPPRLCKSCRKPYKTANRTKKDKTYN